MRSAAQRLAQLVSAALFTTAVHAQSIELAVTMPPGGIAFGEAFELHVDRTAAMIAGEPDPIDERSLAPLVVEPIGQEVVAGGAGQLSTPTTVRLRYRARCFASGDVKIGPLAQRWRFGGRETTATSGQLVLHVKSSLPEPAGGFEWPGDVRDLPSPRWPWFAAAAALLTTCVWWWRRPRAASGPIAILQPAPHTALRELRALAVPGDGADAAAIGAFHGEVKRLVRVHCRERFAIAADVRTSEEVLRVVPARERAAACLLACDLVLFAAVLPPAAERARTLAAAIAFVEGAP